MSVHLFAIIFNCCTGSGLIVITICYFEELRGYAIADIRPVYLSALEEGVGVMSESLRFSYSVLSNASSALPDLYAMFAGDARECIR